MSNLARVISNPCSSSTFNYVKSVHLLANRTSQADVPPSIPENASREYSRTVTNVDMLPRVFMKYPADFCIHPEKLKQIIKEKDAHIFCNYLSKEGYKKRKRCLMIMERKKKLMQAANAGQYTMRNLSLIHKPNAPNSYTSYVNSQVLATMNAKRQKSSYSVDDKGEISEGASVGSLDATRSRTKEIFLNSNNGECPYKHKLVDGNSNKKKKKKKLRPLKVFKKTKYLSKSCEMNLPPDLPLDGAAEWVSHSDSGRGSDIVSVLARQKNNEVCFKAHRAVHADEKAEACYSAKCKFYTKKNLGDDGFVDNVFTLFDRVKLDSKKHKSKGTTEGEGGVGRTKSFSSDPKETYTFINAALKSKEMHLKKQFSQICSQPPKKDKAAKRPATKENTSNLRTSTSQGGRSSEKTRHKRQERCITGSYVL